jgi:hypothetical protein
MTGRATLINDLELLLNECFETIENLRKYQQIKENDARVTFFKHLVNVIDSTILFLIVARKYLGDENWWKGIQQEYNLSTRPIAFGTEFDYYDQLVTLSFFHLIFSSFESSIRLIVKRYDSQLYRSQKDFNPLTKGLLNKLKILGKDKDKFIDLIASVRYSIHNNGLYVPRGTKKNNRIVWNNMLFRFDEDKPIIIKDLWSHLLPFSREIYKAFSDIVNSDEIKKINYYNDGVDYLAVTNSCVLFYQAV